MEILYFFGRSLRAGLYAYTARALATGLVSASIPNADRRLPVTRRLLTPTALRWSTLSSPAAESG